MFTLNTTHSKMKTLLHPYIKMNEETQTKRSEEGRQDDHNNNGDKSIMLVDEQLMDFGCKYRITIERYSQATTEDNDIVISTYVGIVGWDEVKDNAISVLKCTFGDANVRALETQTSNMEEEEEEEEEKEDLYNLLATADYNVLIQLSTNKIALDQHQGGQSLASIFQSLCQVRYIILGSGLKMAFLQLKKCSITEENDHQEQTFTIPIQRRHDDDFTASPTYSPIKMWVTSFGQERVTIVIPIIFRQESDRALAKLFAQQIKQEAQQQQSCAKIVPICDFRRPNEPPREILKLLSSNNNQLTTKNKSEQDENHTCTCKFNGNLAGYLTFTFFERQFRHTTKEEEEVNKVVENILSLYEFLDYHVKCSKAYVHTRLREKKNVMLNKMTCLAPQV